MHAVDKLNATSDIRPLATTEVDQVSGAVAPAVVAAVLIASAGAGILGGILTAGDPLGGVFKDFIDRYQSGRL